MIGRMWRQASALMVVIVVIVASSLAAPAAMAQESTGSDSGRNWLTVSLIVGIVLAVVAIVLRLRTNRRKQ